MQAECLGKPICKGHQFSGAVSEQQGEGWGDQTGVVKAPHGGVGRGLFGER